MVETVPTSFLDLLELAYFEAMNNGYDVSYRARINIIGHSGAGKTSLTRRLLGKSFQPEHHSTNGIETHLIKFDPKKLEDTWEITEFDNNFKNIVCQKFRRGENETDDDNEQGNTKKSAGPDEEHSSVPGAVGGQELDRTRHFWSSTQRLDSSVVRSVVPEWQPYNPPPSATLQPGRGPQEQDGVSLETASLSQPFYSLASQLGSDIRSPDEETASDNEPEVPSHHSVAELKPGSFPQALIQHSDTLLKSRSLPPHLTTEHPRLSSSPDIRALGPATSPDCRVVGSRTYPDVSTSGSGTSDFGVHGSEMSPDVRAIGSGILPVLRARSRPNGSYSSPKVRPLGSGTSENRAFRSGTPDARALESGIGIESDVNWSIHRVSSLESDAEMEESFVRIPDPDTRDQMEFWSPQRATDSDAGIPFRHAQSDEDPNPCSPDTELKSWSLPTGTTQEEIKSWDQPQRTNVAEPELNSWSLLQGKTPEPEIHPSNEAVSRRLPPRSPEDADLRSASQLPEETVEFESNLDSTSVTYSRTEPSPESPDPNSELDNGTEMKDGLLPPRQTQQEETRAESNKAEEKSARMSPGPDTDSTLSIRSPRSASSDADAETFAESEKTTKNLQNSLKSSQDVVQIEPKSSQGQGGVKSGPVPRDSNAEQADVENVTEQRQSSVKVDDPDTNNAAKGISEKDTHNKKRKSLPNYEPKRFPNYEPNVKSSRPYTKLKSGKTKQHHQKATVKPNGSTAGQKKELQGKEDQRGRKKLTLQRRKPVSASSGPGSLPMAPAKNDSPKDDRNRKQVAARPFSSLPTGVKRALPRKDQFETTKKKPQSRKLMPDPKRPGVKEDVADQMKKRDATREPQAADTTSMREEDRPDKDGIIDQQTERQSTQSHGTRSVDSQETSNETEIRRELQSTGYFPNPDRLAGAGQRDISSPDNETGTGHQGPEWTDRDEQAEFHKEPGAYSDNHNETEASFVLESSDFCLDADYASDAGLESGILSHPKGIAPGNDSEKMDETDYETPADSSVRAHSFAFVSISGPPPKDNLALPRRSPSPSLRAAMTSYLTDTIPERSPSPSLRAAMTSYLTDTIPVFRRTVEPESDDESEDLKKNKRPLTPVGASRPKGPDPTTLAGLRRALLEIGHQDTRKKGRLRLWDFGGQEEFYATHHLFLDPSAACIIVLDMSKKLEDKVRDTKTSFSEGIPKTQEDMLCYWLHTIKSKSTEKQMRNTLTIVLTHSDCIPSEPHRAIEIEKYKENIRKCLKNKKLSKCIKENRIFAVSNLESTNSDFAKLRKSLLDMFREQTIPPIRALRTEEIHSWGMHVPARWLRLEDLIEKTCRDTAYEYTQGEASAKSKVKKKSHEDDTTVKYLRREYIEELAKECNITPRDVEPFLLFHHALGDLIYYPDPQLRDYIITDPQWLVDKFKALIAPLEFVIDSVKDLPKIRTDLGTLLAYGKVTREGLDEFWTENQNPAAAIGGDDPDAAANESDDSCSDSDSGDSSSGTSGLKTEVQFLIDLMQKFNLLLPLDWEDVFLIPCMMPVKKDLNFEWSKPFTDLKRAFQVEYNPRSNKLFPTAAFPDLMAEFSKSRRIRHKDDNLSYRYA